jgi:hypothetical protein
MEPAVQDAPKASFQSAATTLKCRFIDDNVTIMVHSDWTAMCCWYRQNMEASTGSPVKAKRQKRRQMEACKGPQCEHVTEYRDRLLAEERQRSGSQGS